ncbi:hypothetical protein RFI_25624 [Reticulomyxa filosa]|uniref:Uncharacterized protein n=1 Tax=Reticulomyxa filosa TaxID=46433 RepID=X6ME98_RETFI|nr:hypothetical protein RFI_25624 [Reticulomyxa filosa]|eukprot:ETO11752.1 hypothetical protein RFI_25624 [Reticulomyxa filosa]
MQSGALKLLLDIQIKMQSANSQTRNAADCDYSLFNGKSVMKSDMLSGLFGDSKKETSENDDIPYMNVKKRRTNEQSSQMQVQIAVRPEVDDKKKEEEITFSNMWKFSTRIDTISYTHHHQPCNQHSSDGDEKAKGQSIRQPKFIDEIMSMKSRKEKSRKYTNLNNVVLLKNVQFWKMKKKSKRHWKTMAIQSRKCPR